MRDLTSLRSALDVIDSQLAGLFQDRMAVIREIAAYKEAHHLAVLQEGREAQVIGHALSLLRSPEDAPYVKDFFEQLLRISKTCQIAKLDAAKPSSASLSAIPGPIGFPGTEGSFSQQAAALFFGDTLPYQAFDTFEGVLSALAEGDIQFAVLPIENSSAGAVSDTYDLLLKYNLFIAGEQLVPVAHHLLGVPGSSIERIQEVHSHPQALAQCHAYLSTHPGMTAVPSLNTAISAKQVSQWKDLGKAAIASSYAAKCYGLTMLKENIHDNPFNTTRFVVVSREKTSLRPANKATVTFHVPNEVGSLATLLHCFASHGVNLSKIESRPIPGKPWEYAFIADFEGAMDEPSLQEALAAATACSRELRLLGRYGKAQ